MDNLKESCEQLDASNGKDMKNIEEKMPHLETESKENQKKEEQMEIEKCNEAKNNEEDFFVPNWLVEVLEWIKRKEMAESKLSTSCWAFNELCGPKLHGKNVKPHMVGRILLNQRDVKTGNMWAIVRYGRQLLPIPSTPPPDYILGFECIEIYFLDDHILEFIKCILPKIDGVGVVVNMPFDGYEWKLYEENKRIQAIKCLLNVLVDRISYFCFVWNSDFKNFNRLFPQFINKCQCISISTSLSNFQNPEYDIFFEWLTNRLQMDVGKQKVQNFYMDNGFDYYFGRIKKEFLNSTKPLNFLVLFGYVRTEHDVVFENENTGEVLMLIPYLKEEFYGRLILRCPKGQEERWKKEGEKKIDMVTFINSDDVTIFELDIRNIHQFG